MARRTTTATRTKKAAEEKPRYKCRDCIHSYDWSGRAYDGSLMLCRCRHDKKSQCGRAYDGSLMLCRCRHDKKSQCGRFCKFLSDPQCEHFVKREGADHGKPE